jgi:hypothetical protein
MTAEEQAWKFEGPHRRNDEPRRCARTQEEAAEMPGLELPPMTPVDQDHGTRRRPLGGGREMQVRA